MTDADLERIKAAIVAELLDYFRDPEGPGDVREREAGHIADNILARLRSL